MLIYYFRLDCYYLLDITIKYCVKINIYTENVPQHNLYIILYADLYTIE